jgi:hypothetical protein
VGDAAGVDGSETPLLDGRQLRLEEQVRLADRVVVGTWDHALQRRAVLVAAHVAQEPVDGTGHVTGSVGGDDRVQRGSDLRRAGHTSGGGFEQCQRANAVGQVDGQLQRNQRAVGMPDDMGRAPADVIHQSGADGGILGDGEVAVRSTS